MSTAKLVYVWFIENLIWLCMARRARPVPSGGLSSENLQRIQIRRLDWPLVKVDVVGKVWPHTSSAPLPSCEWELPPAGWCKDGFQSEH
ncbi:hypothetical protein NECAME_05523 [Necator americanus]|uniref:Secreted protein n=1 Tax=Necator americanus TaxID=51031 RepID=W2SGK4_NECAM|nr:hypothetical protein NECAME_05523 [Necator americanus]ETN68678.1 hypothetical protein NECAME_05523 [Necator americanus]